MLAINGQTPPGISQPVDDIDEEIIDPAHQHGDRHHDGDQLQTIEIGGKAIHQPIFRHRDYLSKASAMMATMRAQA